MSLAPLTAITPIDGRYRLESEPLGDHFSEAALIRYRVRVEIEYFIALCRIPLSRLTDISPDQFSVLRRIWEDFTMEDAERVKEWEGTLRHDIKAVEYFLRERMEETGFGEYKEFVHFGLTSQDINNTAIPLALKEAMESLFLPRLKELRKKLGDRSREWDPVPMLARTHGQPASPTTVGKEVKVFLERLKCQVEQLEEVPYSAKFGGATGNFNAHHAAYPEIDWPAFADSFVGGLGLKRARYTTQIEHYDNLAARFDALSRINTILIDLCRDLWSYISLNYFKQRTKSSEVGSSTMPHKVNPIDLENAEGNLGMANSIFSHLSEKLPISRMQRDLTDSTAIRNTGVPIAHSFIAMNSILKGLDKLEVNRPVLEKDLEENWVVLAESIQTVLRREGYPEPYEVLKGLTRGQESINKATLHAFIDGLDVGDPVKAELKALTPAGYTGQQSSYGPED